MYNKRKFLSSFFLIIQSFLISTCFYSMSGCSTGEPKKVVIPGLEAEYLVLNEKILLNFFGTPDEKDWAVKTLERRCENGEDPHACYNLSTHLFALKDFNRALKYSELAVRQNPKDFLYVEMYRQTLLENGKLETKKDSIFPEEDNSHLITKLELECRNNNTNSTFQIASELTSKNVLSYESIRNGFLPECLNEKMVSELSSKAKRNKVNFTNLYYSEKNKNNLFYSIWDTSYLTKRKPLEKEDDLKHKLTEQWQSFRKAVAAKNEKLVRKYFKDFMNELNQEKAKAKKDSHLYLAIERAAKLLIEQDEFFAKYRSLAKDL